MKQPRTAGVRAPEAGDAARTHPNRAAAVPEAAAPHAAAAPLGSPRLLAQRRVLQAAGLEEEEPLQAAGMDEEELLQGAALEEEEPLQGAGLEEEEPLQGAGLEEEEPLQGRGLPPALAAGVHQLAGVSVADVRVHRGSALPAQVGAAAYAQGADIHLAPGQDQHLPHEAWHVAQQRQGRVQPTAQVAGVPVNDNPALEAEADRMGAQAQAVGAGALAAGHAQGALRAAGSSAAAMQRRPSPTAPLQRLSVTGTAWGSATTAEVTAGSGQGVAIIGDGGSKVVVKGNQGWGNEVVVYSELLAGVLGSPKGKEQLEQAKVAKAITARARMATGGEIATIAGVVRNLAPEIATDPGRKTKVINDISTQPTVVYEYVPGQDYEDIVAEYGSGERKASEKKGITRKRVARGGNNPLVDLWQDPGQMQMLGKGTAADIVSGNGDRILRYFNPKNFRFDEQAQQMVMIDNVAKSGEVFLGDNAAFNVTARQSFADWSRLHFVAPFINGDDAAIARIAIGQLMAYDIGKDVRAEDQAFVRGQLAAAVPQMEAWFAQGLAAGRSALSSLEGRVMAFTGGIPAPQRREFAINLLARMLAVRFKSTDYDMLTYIAKNHLGYMD